MQTFDLLVVMFFVYKTSKSQSVQQPAPAQYYNYPPPNYQENVAKPQYYQNNQPKPLCPYSNPQTLPPLSSYAPTNPQTLPPPSSYPPTNPLIPQTPYGPTCPRPEYLGNQPNNPHVFNYPSLQPNYPGPSYPPPNQLSIPTAYPYSKPPSNLQPATSVNYPPFSNLPPYSVPCTTLPVPTHPIQTASFYPVQPNVPMPGLPTAIRVQGQFLPSDKKPKVTVLDGKTASSSKEPEITVKDELPPPTYQCPLCNGFANISPPKNKNIPPPPQLEASTSKESKTENSRKSIQSPPKAGSKPIIPDITDKLKKISLTSEKGTVKEKGNKNTVPDIPKCTKGRYDLDLLDGFLRSIGADSL